MENVRGRFAGNGKQSARGCAVGDDKRVIGSHDHERDYRDRRALQDAASSNCCDSEEDDYPADCYLLCPVGGYEAHARSPETPPNNLDHRGIRPADRPLVLLTPILIPAGWTKTPSKDGQPNPFEGLGLALARRWPHVLHYPYPTYPQGAPADRQPGPSFERTQQSHHDFVEQSNALIVVVVTCEPNTTTPGAGDEAHVKRNIGRQADFASECRQLVENPASKVGASGAYLWVVRFGGDRGGRRPDIAGFKGPGRREATDFIDMWAYTAQFCPEDVAAVIVPDDMARSRNATHATSKTT